MGDVWSAKQIYLPPGDSPSIAAFGPPEGDRNVIIGRWSFSFMTQALVLTSSGKHIKYSFNINGTSECKLEETTSFFDSI